MDAIYSWTKSIADNDADNFKGDIKHDVLLDDEFKKGKKREIPPIRSRPNPETKLTVHMVAHSHDDVGWRKTYNDYFTGLMPDITGANVERILSGVVFQLL